MVRVSPSKKSNAIFPHGLSNKTFPLRTIRQEDIVRHRDRQTCTVKIQGAHSQRMTKKIGSDKEIVQYVLLRMPDYASLQDIAQELEFIAAVREGLSGFDDMKDSISIEKFEPRVPSWTVTVGRKRRGRQKRKAGDSLKPPAPSPNA